MQWMCYVEYKWITLNIDWEFESLSVGLKKKEICEDVRLRFYMHHHWTLDPHLVTKHC